MIGYKKLITPTELRPQLDVSDIGVPMWVPVTKRLPDTYTAVLVSDGEYVWIDSLEDDFDGDGNYIVWWDSSSVDFDKTVWMPLPKPL